MIRQQIMDGTLQLPITDKFEQVFGKQALSTATAMWNAMWSMYLSKGDCTPISSPHWAGRMANPTAMVTLQSALSKSGWVHSRATPGNNWGEMHIRVEKLLQYCTQSELDQVRMNNGFNHYKLEQYNPFVSYEDMGVNDVSSNGKLTKGNARVGYAKTATVPFQFDVVMMHKHRAGVIELVNKGISKAIEKYNYILDDHANYANIAEEVVDYYIASDDTYMGGKRRSEPRHRNVAGYLNKVGNPVGYKVMRSLLVIPHSHRNVITPKGLVNKYLFIAELLSFRTGTVDEKANFGRVAYYNRTLNYDTIEELPENIWLERTYQDIDNSREGVFGNAITSTRADKYITNPTERNLQALISAEASITTRSSYKWSVPSEIDMSASVLGYAGLLLNHAPFMRRTNMVGDTLMDAWGHDVITNRPQFKTIMRQVYGSGMSAKQMWEAMDIEHTQAELTAFDKELESGELSVAVAMKDFIIGNCNLKPTMRTRVNGESFNIECNKFFYKGETTTKYSLFDTANQGIFTISNTSTIKVPDLQSFKRWTMTGLIHTLDGQTMDRTVSEVYDTYGWVLDIHDAMIIDAEAADYGRQQYATKLETIHTNRNTILSEYFTSIGIAGSKVAEWKREVMSKVVPFEGTFKCSPMVLK